MNAVHFGRGAKTYHGVDIAASTLAECGRQMQRERLAGFVPVLVDANQARAALPQIGNQADLFICTYLFELLPSEAHALELLDIAHAVLRPGGVALVHIRCSSGVLGRSRPWDYAQNMAHNVTFSVDQFRQVCKAAGFQVLEVVARPTVPELNEKDYAYYVLLRLAQRSLCTGCRRSFCWLLHGIAKAGGEPPSVRLALSDIRPRERSAT